MKKALLTAALVLVGAIGAKAQTGSLVIDGKVYDTACVQEKLKSDCLPKGGEQVSETIRVPGLGVRLRNCPALESCK